MNNTNSYYVYGHYTADDNRLFYIGKGSGYRAHSVCSRNIYWNRIVNKHGLKIKILINNLLEHEAFEYEMQYIEMFRLMGHKLCNMTDGGEGGIGRKISEEHRKKIIQTNTGSKRSEETKQKMRDSHKNRSFKNINWGKSNLGKKLSTEHKLKISMAMKNVASNSYKKVQCIENGKIFNSVNEASLYYGFHPSNISKSIKHNYKAAGFTWKYI